MSEDNPLYGLFRFKQGFGGDFTEFVGEMDLVLDPFGLLVLWSTAPSIFKELRKPALSDQKPGQIERRLRMMKAIWSKARADPKHHSGTPEKRAGGAVIWAVLKGNGYGLGAAADGGDLPREQVSITLR